MEKERLVTFYIEKIGYFIILIGLILLIVLGRKNNIDLTGFEMLIGFILGAMLR